MEGRMLERLLIRIKEKETRRVFGALLAGKVIAATLLIALMKGIDFFFATPAYAEEAAKVAPYINPINTVWTLIAAFLVFFMQAGFMCLEAGFARSRETVNILLEGIVDTMMCGILFWAFGFAFMFGSGNKFIGLEFFFLHGTPETYGTTERPILTYCL